MHETLLIGSHDPIELDAVRIARRFDEPSVATALREIGVDSPQSLLATWVTDRVGLEAYAGKAKPVTDDDPRIEYGPWVLPNEITRVLPHLMGLQSDPPVAGADEQLMTQIRTERDRLHRFYSAGLHAYRGERDRWAQALRSVVTEDPRNTYYRWIVSGE
jgi:spermidine synthase